MADGRRSSILKPPKQRAPLQEVNSLNIHHQDDFTSATVTQNILRRVSFAGTSTVKEFDAQAESVLVCHTPAYEESFAASDSSVPSDHSSRLSSRSTISIEDQSSLPAARKDTSGETVHCEDAIFLEFGVPIGSQLTTKISQRRARFSIDAPADDDSPTVKEAPSSSIPAGSFYGKQSPKPRMSVFPSLRSQRLLTIDPFTLRPKPVSNSPKSQPKRKSTSGPAQPSPKSKSPALRFAPSPNESSSSEMELTEAISGNIFVTTPSPMSSVGTCTPPSLQRTVVESVNMDESRVCTAAWKNQTAYGDEMDFTRVMPTKILNKTDVRSSDPGDGSLHSTFRNSLMMEFPQPVTSVAIRNEQHLVTDANKSMTCTTNSVVTGLCRSAHEPSEMGLHQPTELQPESMEITGIIHGTEANQLGVQNRWEPGIIPSNVNVGKASIVPASGLNTTVLDTEGMEFTEVVPSLPVLEKDVCNRNRGELDARNVTVCEPDGMEFTKVIPGSLLSGGSETSDRTLREAFTSMPTCDEDNTTPIANKTLNDSMGMDFTEAIPYLPELHIPCRGNSFPAEPSNQTLNDSVGMELTKAIPSEPILLVPDGIHSSNEHAVAHRTICDLVNMELTQTVPGKTLYNISEDATESVSRMTEPNKIVYESSGMDFTKAASAPLLMDSSKAHESSKLPFSEERSCTKPVEIEQFPPADSTTKSLALQTSIPVSQSRNDGSVQRSENLTSCTSITKLPTRDFQIAASETPQETVRTSNEPAVARTTQCDSVDMELTRTAPAKPFYNISEGAVGSVIPMTDSNRTVFESSGMDFTKTGSAPILLNISKGNESFKLSSSEESKCSKSIELEQFPSVDPTTESISLKTSIPVSQSSNVTTLQRIENLTLSASLKLPPARDSHTAASVTHQETVQLVTKPNDIETSLSRTGGFLFSSQSSVQLVTKHIYVEASMSRTEEVRTSSSEMPVQEKVPVTKPIDMEARVASPVSQTPVQDTVQPVSLEGDISSASDNIRAAAESSGETSLIAHISNGTISKAEICRKRSFDEVDQMEQDEVAAQKSRFLGNSPAPAEIAPSEIVIPSSRSPSPVEHDSSTRFPGLSQSFSGNCSLIDSKAASFSNPPVTNDSHSKEFSTISAEAAPEVKEVNSTASDRAVREVSFSCSPSVTFPPVNTDAPASCPALESEAVRLESESVSATSSLTSEEVLRSFRTADECNMTDLPDKTKGLEQACLSFGTDKLQDISLPSIAEVSDCCVEQDASSNERLYATLLQAQHNVSVFHITRGQDSSIGVSTDVLRDISIQGEGVLSRNNVEEMKMSGSEAPETGVREELEHTSEEHGRYKMDNSRSKKRNMSVCEEPETQKMEEERKDLTKQTEPRSRSEKIAVQTWKSGVEKATERLVPGSSSEGVIPNKPSLSTEPNRGNLFDRASLHVVSVPRAEFTASRPAEEVIKAHRLEYRKRNRCNWTAVKLSDGEWSWDFLDGLVELRIKVDKSSRSELLPGHGGRFISLIDKSLHGVLYIGGRLLYQKLSSDEWASRLQKTPNISGLVEDVNRVANEVEVFMTTLGFLQMTKNIDVTHDWIRFNVLSKKSSDIWFKVKVDCRDIPNIQPSNVTIENILGHIRETDIQNLITCVKKSSYLFKNYVAIVQEYLETIERIR